MAGSGRRRRVSMADVALRAGVSVTTVSHVVNRTRTLAERTESAVLVAIAETGYVPDDVVRSMRTIGSRTVGLAMSAISNPYFGDVVHVIERTLSSAGYSLLLVDTHDDVSTELRAMSELLTKGVDAIILAPTAGSARALAFAAQKGVPVIIIDRSVDGDVDQVFTESTSPTALLVDHFVSIGHSRIGFVSGKPGLATTEERIAGYQLGLRRNNLQFVEELIVSGLSTSEGGASSLARLLGLPKPPSAVVVANNNMTIGVLRAARQAGLLIPEDMALASFDDFEWADLFRPGLTVIAQPTDLMGQQAAEMVLSRLEQPSLASRRVVLGAKFVHRESCGCGAFSSREPASLSP